LVCARDFVRKYPDASLNARLARAPLAVPRSNTGPWSMESSPSFRHIAANSNWICWEGVGTMGLRFRQSWNIIPGVRFNLGLKSGSVSFGPRGLHYTVGTTGSRVTVGLPGTGLFWTKKIGSGFKASQPPQNQPATNLPPHGGAQAPQQPQTYAPPLGRGNSPITGMQPGRQAYQPPTNLSAFGAGNQGSRFQSPQIQIANAPQFQTRFTGGIPNPAQSPTHAHVFLPSWLVWSVLAVIIIAGLCLAATMLAAVLR
jgi:hypothetical protein